MFTHVLLRQTGQLPGRPVRLFGEQGTSTTSVIVSSYHGAMYL